MTHVDAHFRGKNWNATDRRDDLMGWNKGVHRWTIKITNVADSSYWVALGVTSKPQDGFSYGSPSIHGYSSAGNKFGLVSKGPSPPIWHKGGTPPSHPPCCAAVLLTLTTDFLFLS